MTAKPWRDMTTKEINAIKTKDCSKCIYFANEQNIHSSHCNYLGEKGKRRPCRPGECKEKGVFKAKAKRRKTVA